MEFITIEEIYLREIADKLGLTYETLLATPVKDRVVRINYEYNNACCVDTELGR